MSNQQRGQSAPANAMPDFGMDTSMLDGLNESKSLGAMVPVNQTAISITGEIVTAQKVAIERDMRKIYTRLAIHAAAAGPRWFYRIPFKNKKTGQTDYVEGISIKGVNGVFREYGNCLLTTRVQDTPTHWIIYARFVDLETGSTYDRPFQQRKSQDTGMGDAERRADMVFQIGVSKATRNVLANALEDLCAFALEEAKKGLVARVNKNPDGAKKYIIEKLAELKIDVKRVAAVYGRKVDHWTVPDLAKIYAELTSIEDGMVDASEMYPVDVAQEQKSGPQTTTTFTDNHATGNIPSGGGLAGSEEGVTIKTVEQQTAAQKATYAQVEDMLRKATTKEEFDVARSHIKDMPLDQVKELSAQAAVLYQERFTPADETPAPKNGGKTKPPLF